MSALKTISKKVMAGCLCALVLVGCASEQKPIFNQPDPALVWPRPPRQARIAYVGQISLSSDLKPATDPFAAISAVAFGKAGAKALLTPFSLCTDGADRLFVADPGAQVVHVFDLKSRKYEQWKPTGNVPFTQPVGVAWDPAGRLLVSDSVSGRLFVFNANGKFAGEIGFGILQRPAGIAIDPVSRSIYVADVAAHQVVVLSTDGKLASRIGKRGSAPGEFNFPTNVLVDRQGYLYVTDALNFRVQTFSPDMKPVRTLGRQGDAPGYFGQPKGIALDSDDHLYVVDAQQEVVQIFDVGKRLLLFFGGDGHGPGQFWLPAGICIDSHNRIWIADSYNRRVCAFDYLPEKQP